MEHKLWSINNEQQAGTNEVQAPKAQGVIFIKTRMSDDKIHALVAGDIPWHSADVIS